MLGFWCVGRRCDTVWFVCYNVEGGVFGQELVAFNTIAKLVMQSIGYNIYILYTRVGP